jgi:hypothetical protein
VESGESPRLFGVEPSKPRIQAVRIVDMSGSRDRDPAPDGSGPDLCLPLCLFTLVGIAGEDDIDAPDLKAPMPPASAAAKPAPNRHGRLKAVKAFRTAPALKSTSAKGAAHRLIVAFPFEWIGENANPSELSRTTHMIAVISIGDILSTTLLLLYYFICADSTSQRIEI